MAGLVGGRGADARDLPADAPSEESSNPGRAKQDVLDFSVGLSDCIVCLLGLTTVALSLVSVVPIGTDRFSSEVALIPDIRGDGSAQNPCPRAISLGEANCVFTIAFTSLAGDVISLLTMSGPTGPQSRSPTHPRARGAASDVRAAAN